MALTKVQWQLRYPYLGNPDGYYYWTNAYFKDVVDPTDFTAYIPDMEQIVIQASLFECQVNWLRVQSPPESDPPLEDVFAFNHFGESAYSGGTILENVARVNLYVGVEYVGYRLLRAAVPTDLIVDGRISSGILSSLQSGYADALIANEQTTRDGRLLTSAVVDGRIHMWQLRHGTKRRHRGVLHT